MPREHVLAHSDSRCPDVRHKSRAHHVRRVDQRIAALQILIAHPIFDQLADDPALGVEENQPRTGQLLDAEQIELLAQLAMVALLGFFELGEVLVELLLVKNAVP